MRRALVLAASALGLISAAPKPAQTVAPKLLVVSVDGLDQRYLRDADALGLRIPVLRRLMREGRASDGVVGVWPTVTWPSHTSIVTGARPDQHGIRSNGRPGSPLYWSADQVRAPTLYGCASAHGRTTAAVTWPSTNGAAITWNLPEEFKRRQGGSMDLESAERLATPGLVAAISRRFPSFPQQWIDDRTRVLATRYMLEAHRPDLLLVHLVDLDSEAHDRGPFGPEADAILERTDELLGDLLAHLPPGYRLVVTSDHGFERVDHDANLPVLLKEAGVAGEVQVLGGVAVARDPAAAAFLRGLSARGESAVGREVPREEVLRHAPALADAAAVFEPAPHHMFGRAAAGPYLTPPHEKGNHGFWPGRADYRSVFIAWGPGVRPGREPELQMTRLKDRLASLMGLSCP